MGSGTEKYAVYFGGEVKLLCVGEDHMFGSGRTKIENDRQGEREREREQLMRDILVLEDKELVIRLAFNFSQLQLCQVLQTTRLEDVW